MKPILKWSGKRNKSQLDDLLNTLPQNYCTIIDKNCGNCAAVFHILNKRNDINAIITHNVQSLIDAYIAIQKNGAAVLAVLLSFQTEYLAARDKVAYYNEKRRFYNCKCNCFVTQAALFIFLNRTCYNGMYRENKKGKFNVSHGKHKANIVDSTRNFYSVIHSFQKGIITPVYYGDLNSSVTSVVNPIYLY